MRTAAVALGTVALAVGVATNGAGRCRSRLGVTAGMVAATVASECGCCSGSEVSTPDECVRTKGHLLARGVRFSSRCVHQVVRAARRYCLVGCPACTPDRCQFYLTCGAPVCSADRATTALPFPVCTSEHAGDPCTMRGQTCDPQSGCGNLLVCASAPVAFACPISRRAHKRDIRYLTEADRVRLRNELVRRDPRVSSSADLYGALGRAVAAIQVQERDLTALREQVAALRRGIDAP